MARPLPLPLQPRYTFDSSLEGAYVSPDLTPNAPHFTDYSPAYPRVPFFGAQRPPADYPQASLLHITHPVPMHAPRNYVPQSLSGPGPITMPAPWQESPNSYGSLTTQPRAMPGEVDPYYVPALPLPISTPPQPKRGPRKSTPKSEPKQQPTFLTRLYEYVSQLSPRDFN
jgi:hypothetical protein